ncbi:DEAD/DEAH box helicase [Tessaracoccus sp. MC1756]|uniref:DEAD/DEAH box helicase n=1 Tax=Tessaracoccus sp. MC1756 TaxID=2760311 RepID=UPI0015FF2C26|nr:DEAD/DEAH box helicase [Tessaracoccus sp. MC1756]MBB1509512.1 DEAD/DEAH box helicase [Tessaracoccus sp. MC1756]
MTSPNRKARWSADKRATKGLNPQRRGVGRTDRRDDSAPLNRKQRRALQFADREPGSENRENQGNDETRRDTRPTSSRPASNWGDRPRRDDRDDRRPPFERDDRRRDDRSERDDRRPSFQRDDRPRRDDRDDRAPRFDRDDRRPRFERDDRRPSFQRDDRPRRDDRDDRGRNDRVNRDDRFNRDDRRPRFDRDDRFGAGPDRRERRSDSWGERPARKPFEQRHTHEPRGHEERRRPFDRDRRNGFDRPERPSLEEFEAEADQMSWEATTAEGVQGEISSGFLELGVHEQLVRVLAAQGITEPFPIQQATIADAIAGRDVLGRGRTGSGKTLAFGLPMLSRLAAGTPVGSPRAIILTPTRELALQIADVLSPLASKVGIDLTLITGGMSYAPQLKAFARGVDVVVATPGRLIDLIEQGAADLSQVQVTVLDEADHMADMGFLTEVRTILDATPEGGQRLLFSATLDNAVGSLVRKYLSNPVTHEVDSEKASVSTMVHRPMLVRPHHKNQVTAEIANRDGRTVLFARTQMGTDRIAAQLRDAGVMAGSLHGGLTQGARARILAAFREGLVPVLVATDVAARGIHVDDVSLVLQVDPPHDSKDYLHRAGRTARAGNEGVVATIVLPHQRKVAQRLLSQAGVQAEGLTVEPGSPELREATGARPVSGVAIQESDYLALIAPKQQPRRRPDGPRGGGRGGYRSGGRSRNRW